MQSIQILRQERREAVAQRREAVDKIKRIDRALDVLRPDERQPQRRIRRGTVVRVDKRIPQIVEGLSNGGMTRTDLGRRFQIGSGSLSYVLKEMKRRDIIAEYPVKKGARIQLSPKRRETVVRAGEGVVKEVGR